MGDKLDIGANSVELDVTDGKAFIGQASPLTRLHYFDGQFLRADAFALEQDYHRKRVQLANIAGGWGAVNGLGIALSGNQLDVSAGLAITPAGNFVLAPTDMQATLDELLKVAAPDAPGGSASFADCVAPKAATAVTQALTVYEITVGPIEGQCGNEPVYGKLCASACASDSDRPYWREGVVLRLRPVSLQLPTSSAVPAANQHLRNRVASAYFRHEPWLTTSIVSGAGLAGDVWCQPATLYGRDEVVIGLLVRGGGVTRVIDAWSGRRERMDTQPRGYWQGRMAMRPWNVFIAQILQFQCQLSGLFEPGKPVILPADDCDRLRTLLTKTRQELETLVRRYGESTKKILMRTQGKATTQEMQSVASSVAASFADIGGLSAQLADAETGQGALPKQRMLLAAGFFELPPAGYLPLDPSAAVPDQVQRMFGEGVRLQYHAVRHDEIAHLLEQAQHMERISLTRGLDDPKQPEDVEVFVPDGKVASVQPASSGLWWRVDMLKNALFAFSWLIPDSSSSSGGTVHPVPGPAAPKASSKAQAKARTAAVFERVQGLLNGLLRTQRRDDGGFSLTMAVSSPPPSGSDSAATRLYLTADIDIDPFKLPVGGTTRLEIGLMSLAETGRAGRIGGTLTVLAQRSAGSGSGVQQRTVQIDLQVSTAEDGGVPAIVASRSQLLLQRDLDASTRVFILDDAAQDPKSAPVHFEWDAAPQAATVFIESANVVSSAGVPNDATRTTLLEMAALPAMPDVSSTLASAALDTLVAIANASNDQAFLLRARQRLLPTLAAPQVQTVRALLDWVMFRRARTPLCAPACPTQVAASTEAFQVWHLALDNEKDLPAIAKALDSADEKALAKLSFKRVGLLSYRDESAFSEEGADRVVAMWKAVPPGARVLLGRIWETAPTTGQGWQNHFRLQNMIDQIASLTQPPATGSGALAAIGLPSNQLADSSYDGGMLVVSSAKPVVVLPPHRVVMITMDLYRKVSETLKHSPVDGWKTLQSVIAQMPNSVIDLDMHFSAGQLATADASTLVQADAKMRTPQHIEYLLHAMRLDAQAVDPAIDAAAQQQDLAKRLANTSSPPREVRDEGNVTIPVADLGHAAQVLMLVGYEGVDLT